MCYALLSKLIIVKHQLTAIYDKESRDHAISSCYCKKDSHNSGGQLEIAILQ